MPVRQPPDPGAGPLEGAAPRIDDPCPVCGGEVAGVKCKRVCTRCRALVENCSGD